MHRRPLDRDLEGARGLEKQNGGAEQASLVPSHSSILCTSLCSRATHGHIPGGPSGLPRAISKRFRSFARNFKVISIDPKIKKRATWGKSKRLLAGSSFIVRCHVTSK